MGSNPQKMKREIEKRKANMCGFWNDLSKLLSCKLSLFNNKVILENSVNGTEDIFC